jgi:myo-inositol-1-phosphate synthase
VLVRMPGELKRLLSEEVRSTGRSLNDVAVGLLASRFGVPFEPSGRPGKEPGSSGSVLLRMPAELKDKLAARAAQRRRNVNDLIVETLAERLAGKESMASTNGKAPRSDEKVRVAIIGVGNCANSLLQGVEYYKDAPDDEFVPGLMHVNLGGYHVRDVEFTAAFDVTADKVGKDLSEAIWAHPNDTIKFADVPKTSVEVARGMTHDGIGKYLSDVVTKAPGETDDVVGILRDTKTDVVVNYLPVGSEMATKWYTEQILEAGCAMVNCMPVFIARENYWQRRFEERGLPIVGDDIKSQVGATITHRVLTSLFRERGVYLDRTMQLNVGGNSDFLNMLERDRLESKKISKTNAVTSMLDYDLGAENVHVGPSDHVPWLTDRKWAYIRMEGKSFGDVPLNVELKLEVWDSPNSAGIVIDAVRMAKLALNNGVAGALEGPSSYLMKSPPKQIVDDEAHELVEQFIAQNARATKKAPAAA